MGRARASSTTRKIPSRPRDVSPAALTIAVDGAARGNPGPAGAGVAITDGKGRVVKEIALSLGETTNNVAEYAALLCALQAAAQLGAKEVRVQTDSELLARQLSGEYRVKDPTLRVFHALVEQLRTGFRCCEVRHVPREQNRAADRLANRAVDAGLRTLGKPKASPIAPPDPMQRTFRFGTP